MGVRGFPVISFKSCQSGVSEVSEWVIRGLRQAFACLSALRTVFCRLRLVSLSTSFH